MDVYLIPVGPDRYELYCEHLPGEEVPDPGAPAGSGFIARMLHRMNAALERVEREDHGISEPHQRPPGWADRLRRSSLRWISERIVEWRLLWKLRKQSAATLFFPDDLTVEQAYGASRTILKREADRHLKWIIIDGVLFGLSGIVAIVPGPNAVAYYFGFRFVGHFLSRRGARHGLDAVIWDYRPSAPLTALRAAIGLPLPDRERSVREAAAALHLQQLPMFFARIAIPPA